MPLSLHALIRETSVSYSFNKMLQFTDRKRENYRDRRWTALKTRLGEKYIGDESPIVLANYVDNKLAKDRRDPFVSACGTKVWTWQTEYVWDQVMCGEGWILSSVPWSSSWKVPFGWPPIPVWMMVIELPPGTYIVPYVPPGCAYHEVPVEWPPPVPSGWPDYPAYDAEHMWNAGWWKPEVDKCPDDNPFYLPPWILLEV